MNAAPTAGLVEIFSSFQGEGKYIGNRQTFLRFGGCNLSCRYCDTPDALEVPKQFRFEATPGKRDFEFHPNPATLDQVLSFVDRLERPKGSSHSVCITGGEPLLQVDFLKALLPELRARHHKSYLETNGVLPRHLEEVIDDIDMVSFDVKLPSATGLSSYLSDHRKALEVAFLKEVFVKIVFTRETNVKELDEACGMIAEVSEEIPLILQPATPHGPIKHWPKPEEAFALHSTAKRKLKEVLVIPQTHRIMGQL